MNTSRPTLFNEETVSTLVEYAKTKPTGMKHYLQLKICPLTSVAIVIGNDGQVSSMDFTGMMDTVGFPQDKFKTIPIGYEWYQENTNTTSTSSHDHLTLREWWRQFLSLVTKIDDAIRRHHGILCYRTEDTSNNNAYNHMILHIVDVISIYFMRQSNEGMNESALNIRSMYFSSIPPNIVDTFTPTLNRKELEFMHNNADLLCYIYGYWHNYSNKPIRVVFMFGRELLVFLELF